MRLLLIFDLDGTLVDSEKLGNQAFIDLITEIDDDVQTLVEKFRGKKLSTIFCTIESEYSIKLPDDFESIYRYHVSELFEKQLCVTPGTMQMFEQIQNPYCIASSGPINKIKHSLKICGLDKYFSTNIYSSYDIGSWKPDPDLFLFVAKSMNYLPENCLVIDDSEVGIQAAENAKMRYLHYCPNLSVNYSKTDNSFSKMTNLVEIVEMIETSI
jgi:HAD superfamily hydrolase (TIGR01509 family)